MTKEIELTFCESVLILIVVDNGLVQHQIGVWRKCTVGLNPYCSGQWSRTLRQVSMGAAAVVLILIVVDNGLVLSTPSSFNGCCSVLILIVVDNGLVLDLIRHY